MEKLMALFKTKHCRKNKYTRHEPTTTTQLQAPELGQALRECVWVQHVYEH